MLAKGTRTLTTARTGAPQSQSTEQAEAVRDWGAVQGEEAEPDSICTESCEPAPGEQGAGRTRLNRAVRVSREEGMKRQRGKRSTGGRVGTH